MPPLVVNCRSLPYTRSRYPRDYFGRDEIERHLHVDEKNRFYNFNARQGAAGCWKNTFWNEERVWNVMAWTALHENHCGGFGRNCVGECDGLKRRPLQMGFPYSQKSVPNLSKHKHVRRRREFENLNIIDLLHAKQECSEWEQCS